MRHGPIPMWPWGRGHSPIPADLTQEQLTDLGPCPECHFQYCAAENIQVWKAWCHHPQMPCGLRPGAIYTLTANILSDVSVAPIPMYSLKEKISLSCPPNKESMSWDWIFHSWGKWGLRARTHFIYINIEMKPKQWKFMLTHSRFIALKSSLLCSMVGWLWIWGSGGVDGFESSLCHLLFVVILKTFDFAKHPCSHF